VVNFEPHTGVVGGVVWLSGDKPIGVITTFPPRATGA